MQKVLIGTANSWSWTVHLSKEVREAAWKQMQVLAKAGENGVLPVTLPNEWEQMNAVATLLLQYHYSIKNGESTQNIFMYIVRMNTCSKQGMN